MMYSWRLENRCDVIMYVSLVQISDSVDTSRIIISKAISFCFQILNNTGYYPDEFLLIQLLFFFLGDVGTGVDKATLRFLCDWFGDSAVFEFFRVLNCLLLLLKFRALVLNDQSYWTTGFKTCSFHSPRNWWFGTSMVSFLDCILFQLAIFCSCQ